MDEPDAPAQGWVELGENGASLGGVGGEWAREHGGAEAGEHERDDGFAVAGLDHDVVGELMAT